MLGKLLDDDFLLLIFWSGVTAPFAFYFSQLDEIKTKALSSVPLDLLLAECRDFSRLIPLNIVVLNKRIRFIIRSNLREGMAAKWQLYLFYDLRRQSQWSRQQTASTIFGYIRQLLSRKISRRPLMSMWCTPGNYYNQKGWAKLTAHIRYLSFISVIL